MRIGSRRPTRYVLVPGPVIMPGLSPSTRPTSWDTVAVFGNAGSIQLTPASLSHAEVAVLDVRACTELGRGAAGDRRAGERGRGPSRPSTGPRGRRGSPRSRKDSRAR